MLHMSSTYTVHLMLQNTRSSYVKAGVPNLWSVDRYRFVGEMVLGCRETFLWYQTGIQWSLHGVKAVITPALQQQNPCFDPW